MEGAAFRGRLHGCSMPLRCCGDASSLPKTGYGSLRKIHANMGRHPMAKHSGGGKGGGKSVPMTGKAASRVQSAADRNSGSPSAKGGFAPRAQSAAAKNAGGRGRAATRRQG